MLTVKEQAILEEALRQIKDESDARALAEERASKAISDLVIAQAGYTSERDARMKAEGALEAERQARQRAEEALSAKVNAPEPPEPADDTELTMVEATAIADRAASEAARMVAEAIARTPARRAKAQTAIATVAPVKVIPKEIEFDVLRDGAGSIVRVRARRA